MGMERNSVVGSSSEVKFCGRMNTEVASSIIIDYLATSSSSSSPYVSYEFSQSPPYGRFFQTWTKDLEDSVSGLPCFS
jgi:hypothetical protein